MKSPSSASSLPSETTGMSLDSSAERSAQFVPVRGGPETTSATVMVVVAYALFWALVLGFVIRIWKSQRAIEKRLVALERPLPDPPPSH